MFAKTTANTFQMMNPTGNTTTISVEEEDKTSHPPTPSSVQQEVAQIHSSTSVDSDRFYATVEGENQQQDMELIANEAYVTTPNIPVEANESYGTTTRSAGPDQLYATVEGEHIHQQQDTKLTQNQPCIASPNIVVESNESYGFTTRSVGPDQLYATVEGESMSYDKQLGYDYVNP